VVSSLNWDWETVKLSLPGKCKIITGSIQPWDNIYCCPYCVVQLLDQGELVQPTMRTKTVSLLSSSLGEWNAILLHLSYVTLHLLYITLHYVTLFTLHYISSSWWRYIFKKQSETAVKTVRWKWILQFNQGDSEFWNIRLHSHQK